MFAVNFLASACYRVLFRQSSQSDSTLHLCSCNTLGWRIRDSRNPKARICLSTCRLRSRMWELRGRFQSANRFDVAINDPLVAVVEGWAQHLDWGSKDCDTFACQTRPPIILMAPEPPSSGSRTLHVSIAKPQALLMASDKWNLIQSLKQKGSPDMEGLINAIHHNICAKGIAATQMQE